MKLTASIVQQHMEEHLIGWGAPETHHDHCLWYVVDDASFYCYFNQNRDAKVSVGIVKLDIDMPIEVYRSGNTSMEEATQWVADTVNAEVTRFYSDPSDVHDEDYNVELFNSIEG